MHLQLISLFRLNDDLGDQPALDFDIAKNMIEALILRHFNVQRIETRNFLLARRHWIRMAVWVNCLRRNDYL